MFRIVLINLKIVPVLVFVLSCSNFSIAQNNPKKERSVFISKKVYDTKYQKKDSIGVMVRGKDTLVQIKTEKPWPSLPEKSDAKIAKSRHSTFFVPQQVFISNYKKSDSIGFMISEADTLVMVKKLFTPAGVRVKYEPRDSTFLEYYKKIAFRSKHKDSTNTETMKYWKEPIKIYFGNNVHKDVVKDVMVLFKQIDEKIDSLSISKVRKLEQSNYVIFNNEGYQYEPRVNKTKAADYFIEWNGKSQIFKGSLRYDTKILPSLKLQIQKIKEIFIGSLGWFIANDSLTCDSFFSNCYSDNKHMTALDWELLKYHYSYGICKGTSLNTFEEQHRTAQQAIRDNNSVNNFYFIH
ncbi:hypothetical protein [Winogradskyella aurantia]|uniref:Glycoside hydrolase n=1 Tax=Winogradskyella aurantia TaxID=1915063 RepID=A0A265UTN5_9FLAO|nr:hypothetical protein [Winogradskyella aurantia]OZV68592.1 hypothetical protein CA834_08970 [Winogradskyella aurantia]